MRNRTSDFFAYLFGIALIFGPSGYIVTQPSVAIANEGPDTTPAPAKKKSGKTNSFSKSQFRSLPSHRVLSLHRAIFQNDEGLEVAGYSIFFSKSLLGQMKVDRRAVQKWMREMEKLKTKSARRGYLKNKIRSLKKFRDNLKKSIRRLNLKGTKSSLSAAIEETGRLNKVSGQITLLQLWNLNVNEGQK